MHENDDQIAHQMERLAEALSGDPLPSAASMWWRLNLRMRREHARRAQQPLRWMTRLAWLALAALVAGAIASIPSAAPAFALGLAGLTAVAIPILIALWAWSRSRA